MWLVEKNINFFFQNLEKLEAVQNQIWNILIGNMEVNNKKDINNELYLYYKNFFNERQHLSEHDINNILNAISKFLHLSTEQSLEWEKWIVEKDFFWSFKDKQLQH